MYVWAHTSACLCKGKSYAVEKIPMRECFVSDVQILSCIAFYSREHLNEYIFKNISFV